MKQIVNSLQNLHLDYKYEEDLELSQIYAVYVVLVLILAELVVSIMQIIMTCKFYAKVKSIKEVNYLPKLLVALGLVASICLQYVVYFFPWEKDNIEFYGSTISIITSLSLLAIFVSWVRF